MDLELVENGDGGDLVKNRKDLSVIFGFENMPYLCLFGGNVEASTPSKRIVTEQAFDFWGNSLLSNNPSIQFNSLTERLLKNVSLTSSNRIIIENTVKTDLKSMEPFCFVKAQVIIMNDDRLLIGIQLTRKDNLDQKEFVYIWDATMSELSSAQFVRTSGGISGNVFDQSFDFSFA